MRKRKTFCFAVIAGLLAGLCAGFLSMRCVSSAHRHAQPVDTLTHYTDIFYGKDETGIYYTLRYPKIWKNYQLEESAYFYIPQKNTVLYIVDLGVEETTVYESIERASIVNQYPNAEVGPMTPSTIGENKAVGFTINYNDSANRYAEKYYAAVPGGVLTFWAVMDSAEYADGINCEIQNILSSFRGGYR